MKKQIRLLFTLIITILSIAGVSQATVTGQWLFDGQNLTDSSGYNNNGVVHSPYTGVGYVSDGSGGHYLEFDGNGRVDIPNSGWDGQYWCTTPNTQFTVVWELCVKVDPAYVQTDGQDWIMQFGDTGAGQGTHLRGNHGLALLPNGTLTTPVFGVGTADDMATSANVKDGQWHDVIVVWLMDTDSSTKDTIKVYVDDVLEYTNDLADITYNDTRTDKADNIPYWSSPGMILGYNEKDPADSNNDPFTGAIDNVRISYYPYYIPAFLTKATGPTPLDAAVDVDLDAVLSWSAGESAQSHDIYFGQNYNEVLNADTSSAAFFIKNQPENSFDPASEGITLAPFKTYYWRIDEVDAGIPGSPLKGEVWSFTTMSYHVSLEDFRAYQDVNDLKLVWSDGTTGPGDAVLSLYDLYYPATLTYDNTASPYFSEIQRIFGTTQNWASGNIEALTLRASIPDISLTGNLYVKISDGVQTSNVLASSPYCTIEHIWGGLRLLHVDIDAFSQQGVDLSAVQSIAIGIQGQGLQGEIDLEAIDLYGPQRIASAPTADLNDDGIVDILDLSELATWWATQTWQVTAVDPGTSSLQAYYAFDGTSGLTTLTDDSGYGRNGSIDAAGSDNWVSDGVSGNCLEFDGAFAGYLPSSVFNGSSNGWTLSFWTRNNSPLEYLGNALLLDVKNTVPAWEQAETNGGLEDGQADPWRHLAFTADYSDGVLSIYADGVLVSQGDITGTFEIPTDQTVLAYDSVSGTYWKGQMDELRVYNTPLSQDEIVWLAKGPSGTVDQFITPMRLSSEPFPDGKIDLLDFAKICESWLGEDMWP